MVVIALYCATAMAAVPKYPEQNAESVLRQFARATQNLQTLSADIELTFKNAEGLHRNTGTLKLMKPNYALITLKGDYPVEVTASDGQNVYILADQTKYTKQAVDSRGKNIDSPWFGLPFRYFFTQNVNPNGSDPDSTSSIQSLGQEISQGEVFRVVVLKGEKPMPYTATFYFGRDSIMHRSVVEYGKAPKQVFFAATLTNIRINSKMNVDDFRFKPPEGAKLDEGFENKLLSLGKNAPDFSLATTAGKRQPLREIMKGKKATLINFWFLSCPPCRREFPFLERLYQQFKEKGT